MIHNLYIKYAASGLFIAIFFSCISVKEDRKLADSIRKPANKSAAVDTSKADKSIKPLTDFITDKNLLALIEKAFSNNFDLKSADESVTIQKNISRQSKLLVLPTLNAAVRASGDRYGKYTMNGVGNFDSNLSSNLSPEQRVNENFTPDYLGAFQSSWEIDIWGKLRSVKKSRLNEYLSTIEGQKFLKTQLVSMVAYHYYEILAVRDEIEVIQNNIRLQQDALNTIISLKEAGRANELGVKQFEAQLINTQSLELVLKNELVSARNSLNQLLGYYPEEFEVSTENNASQSIKSFRNGMEIDAILENRTDVKQAYYQLIASGFDVFSAKAALLPSLTLNAYAGYNAFNSALLADPMSLTFGVVSGLIGPLFNQRELKTRVKVSKSIQLQRFYDYQKRVIAAMSEVNYFSNEMDNLKLIVENRKKEAELMSQAANISLELFKNGYATYLEIIVARREVLRAELEYINEMRRLNMSKINLYKSLGGGWF